MIGGTRPQESIIREVKRIAVGECVFLAVMLAVYAVIGRFSLAVVLGGALGAAYAVLNFYMLGVTVQRVADMADSGEQDEKIAKARMKSSYTTRMVLMVGVVIVAFVLPFVDVLACIIPMLFPRLTILALQLTGRVKSE